MIDLPSHIRFATKWGGGESQVFVRELVGYLNQRMPEGRIVSGACFDKLASVTLPPNELIPKFISAVIKANATCGADKVRENVGIFVKESDIKSLMTTKKVAAQKAEVLMGRARDVMRDSGKSGTEIITICGDLDVALVSQVFDKFEIHTTMEMLCEEFLQVSLGLGQKEEAASLLGLARPNIVQFDSSGSAIDPGLATIHNRGFKTGATVEPKNDKKTGDASEDTQFEITDIKGNGSVELASVSRDGTTNTGDVKVFSIDSFVEKFRVAKLRMSPFENYPDNAVWNDCKDDSISVCRRMRA